MDRTVYVYVTIQGLQTLLNLKGNEENNYNLKILRR